MRDNPTIVKQMTKGLLYQEDDEGSYLDIPIVKYVVGAGLVVVFLYSIKHLFSSGAGAVNAVREFRNALNPRIP